MKIVLRLGENFTIDFRSFGILAFRNGLEYYNFDFSRLIGNHYGTSFEYLVRFGLAIPEF